MKLHARLRFYDRKRAAFIMEIAAGAVKSLTRLKLRPMLPVPDQLDSRGGIVALGVCLLGEGAEFDLVPSRDPVEPQTKPSGNWENAPCHVP
jgi:hypothetical protein